MGEFGIFAKFKQKLTLENQTLILFENVGNAPLTKCYNVLIKFPGGKRVKLQFKGYL